MNGIDTDRPAASCENRYGLLSQPGDVSTLRHLTSLQPSKQQLQLYPLSRSNRVICSAGLYWKNKTKLLNLPDSLKKLVKSYKFSDFFKKIGENAYNFLDFLEKSIKMHTFSGFFKKTDKDVCIFTIFFNPKKYMHFYRIFLKSIKMHENMWFYRIFPKTH